MTKSKYLTKNIKEDDDEIKHNSEACNVYGCPLRGTISSALNSPYYCHFHYGIKFEYQTEITLKIKKYFSLIETLDVCIRPDILYGHDIKKAEQHIEHYLIRKNLKDLFVTNNLYKTQKNILAKLHEFIKIDQVIEQ